MYDTLLKRKPQPDIQAWLAHLAGERIQPVPPLAEFIIDNDVMKVILQELMGRSWVDYGTNRESQIAYLDNLVAFWHFMGYDYVRFELGLGFSSNSLSTQNTALGSVGERKWSDEHLSTIHSLEEMAAHRFPRLEQMDFFPFEYLNAHLPEGMGLILSHGGGFLETLTWMLSMEGLFLNLYDQPELVSALMERIGSLQMDFYRQIVDLDRLVAIFPGDDMGFRTGTLIRPADLRKYILPWHRNLAALAHEHNLRYFLHSCGNLKAIMEDLIEDVRIDGKHSHEDAILPVEEFYDLYGARIGVLGGMDINFLATASPEEVRQRTRRHLEHCSRGRYAMGSGNSIPDYIPVENYLAMIDETLKMRCSHV